MATSDFVSSIIYKDGYSKAFKGLDNAVQTSARGLDKLGGILSGGGLGMLFGGVAGAAGLMGITKATFALGDLGAQSLTTKSSFDSLMRSVGLSTRLLEDLKAASGGTITELVLMQQANTALAGASGQLATEMGAALPKLLEAARAAAKLNPAYGDAEFMFQSLVSGIKRGTPLLIDNTGIVLKVGEATEKYAASIGKSVTELTSQERSLAILRGTLEGADRLLEQTAGSTNQMASSAGKLRTSWTELKTAIGEGLAPGTSAIQEGAASTLNQVTSVLTSTEFTRAMAMLQTYRDRLAALQAIPVDQRTTLDASDIIDAQQAIEKYERQIWALTAAEREMAATSLLVGSASGVMAAALGESDAASAGLNAAILGLSNGMAVLRTRFGEARSTLGLLNSEMTSRAYISGADVLSEGQYTTLTQNRISMERALDVQVKAGILTQEQADYRLQSFDNTVNDHLSSLRKVTTATADYGGVVDTLKSKIGSALSPTFDLSGLTGGLLGGAGGDTFDEAYKRLAAVALRPEEMNIHAGDWADTFEKAGLTGLSPEEASQRARELVEAYSKGLDFSLIDREKIKDNVRQAIRAEELYNSIVDEIYAEMGKEKPKLAQAGASIGNQLNRAATATVQSGAREYVGAWVSILTPEIVKAIDARGRRTGQTQ